MAKTLANLTNSSIGGSGHMEHPSGALEQWGVVNAAAGAITNITLPKPYPGTAYHATASPGVPIAAGPWTIGCAPLNSTTIQVQNTDTVAHEVYWRTIGR